MEKTERVEHKGDNENDEANSRKVWKQKSAVVMISKDAHELGFLNLGCKIVENGSEIGEDADEASMASCCEVGFVPYQEPETADEEEDSVDSAPTYFEIEVITKTKTGKEKKISFSETAGGCKMAEREKDSIDVIRKSATSSFQDRKDNFLEKEHGCERAEEGADFVVTTCKSALAKTTENRPPKTIKNWILDPRVYKVSLVGKIRH